MDLTNPSVCDTICEKVLRHILINNPAGGHYMSDLIYALATVAAAVPNTGDTFPAKILIIVAVIAAAALIFTTVLAKKKRDDDEK